MPRSIPLLLIGDGPDQQTGLGRIGRDLATLMSRMPELRVGYLGLGSRGSRQLPFVQYSIDQRFSNWGELELERCWLDFAGQERGVVLTCWDASRCCWLGARRWWPPRLEKFLQAGHFDLWGYFPVDATGPAGRQSAIIRETLRGYVRTAVPSLWAQGQIEGAEWLPHGLNLSVWQPIERGQARQQLGGQFHLDDFVVGVVASNQARKDWGLVAAACAELKRRLGREFRAWWHTDLAVRHWDIPLLIGDFGLADVVTLSVDEVSDRELAVAYAACDATLHPGLGEGFCYPVAESLACGTPAIVGDYAAAPELVPVAGWKVKPVAFRLDSRWNSLRPVYEPAAFVEAVMAVREGEWAREMCRDSVAHLVWKQLWPAAWRKWIRTGLESFR